MSAPRTADAVAAPPPLGPRLLTTGSGRRIAYRTAEPASPSGAVPVVLLHGIFSTADHWFDLGIVDALAGGELGRRVVAIDALAHGASDSPPDQTAYALDRRVADVVAVLDAEGIAHAHVWGYSMGGWNACGMARHAPQRTAGLLVGGWDPTRGLTTAYEAFAELLGVDVDIDWYPALESGGLANPATAAEIARRDEGGYRRCHRACELDADLAGAVVAHAGPTLLQCGEDDPYHEPMRALADRAGASFTTLPGDHGRAWNRPAVAIASATSFLADLD